MPLWSGLCENILTRFLMMVFFLCFVRCKILDKHLAILAKKHVETKFIKLNVEKAPFLTERLRIKIIPTLALLVDGKSKDYVVGFTDLGNTDEFSTEMLEWRLGCADVINYRWTICGYNRTHPVSCRCNLTLIVLSFILVETQWNVLR